MLYNLKSFKYEDFDHIEFFTSPIKRTVTSDNNNITDVIKEKKIPLLSKVQRDINKDHTLEVSVNRSKRQLFNIARSNSWEWFITITFDPKYTDSTDYDECGKKITKWLNNLKSRKCPDLIYLLVPELHPKHNIRYHFHGLLANCNGLTFENSGHQDCFGKDIYNITDWTIGWTTAQMVEDSNKVSSYISKYISKELLVTGKYRKRYFASDNCKRVKPELLLISENDLYDHIDIDNIVNVKTININGINKIKYYEVKK